jgi:4-aminobutyrate aminotransferase-like enzyme
MKIQLKGDIHPELLCLGLKEGDIIDAQKDPISKVGALHFPMYVNGHLYSCTVWPENYDIIAEKELMKNILELDKMSIQELTAYAKKFSVMPKELKGIGKQNLIYKILDLQQKQSI